ncbi:Heme NO binding protein [Marinomonas aquimarina]|uniref:Heme NO binding protein n=1 Tax=Marinomonas aquimarina TaxID=295068 RepID=A0A1A8TPC5_9GAMM|nr:heme NO-binding domain-containing protein [Marinomonas aquimarina]SBS35156.1 Heme NO binding protein [Marinomonas aquimarina]
MLGVVYIQFMEMIKEKFSEDVLDDLLDEPSLSTGGAYTSVGYYDHTDIIKLVVALSKKTDIPVDDLVEAFGKHLFAALIDKYPMLAEDKTDALEMLESVDNSIHVEVHKLYPQAELPEFKCIRLSDTKLQMVYRSKRPFSILALGLIKGCAEHFGEQLTISHRNADSDDMFETHFDIEKVA